MSKAAPWISIEGVDGAGKSSHIANIVALLEEEGFEVTSTREPGGTPLGERLREEILNTPMALTTEVLLAFASRAEHMHSVINPALDAGRAVVCDRFTDSTYAYQGGGQGFDVANIDTLANMVHPNRQPDLTLIFDLPVSESLRRLNLTGKDPDKFESQSEHYFERVRQAYLSRARDNPHRVVIIDSQPALTVVKDSVRQTVRDFLARWPSKPKPSRTMHP